MPIAATDLIGYNALNRPEDDVATAGGGIDVDTRPDFTQLAANDDVEIVSDNAGDTTQTVTIRGRDAAGEIVTENLGLNGTTVVTGTQVFERILAVTLDADAAGTVTVRRQPGGATICTIPPAERGVSMTFRNSASEASQAIRYDKVFFRNSHATLTLHSAAVELTADPASRIRIGVHTAKDDTTTITNRKTTPAGITFVDDAVSQAVPGDTLEASSAIGIWVEQDLPADDSPIRSTYTIELSGTTV